MARPSKPPLSDLERREVLERRAEGWGWESLAAWISNVSRQALNVATPEARSKRTVSHAWLRRQFSNETISPTKQHNSRSMANLQRNTKTADHSGSRMPTPTLEETGDHFL